MTDSPARRAHLKARLLKRAAGDPGQGISLNPCNAVAVGMVAAFIGPVLILASGGCCSGGGLPFLQIFVIPALPLLLFFQVVGLESIVSIAFSMGASYGVLFYVAGLLIMSLRKPGT